MTVKDTRNLEQDSQSEEKTAAKVTEPEEDNSVLLRQQLHPILWGSECQDEEELTFTALLNLIHAKKPQTEQCKAQKRQTPLILLTAAKETTA